MDPDAAPGRPEPLFPPPGSATALLRGVRKRCPRCGVRGVFETWFQARARCPRCDLRFEQETGGFLGAMTLNFAIAIAVWVVMIGVWLVFTVPDVPVVPMLIASVVVLVLVPLWFFPRSKMLWAAVEYLVARAEPDYRPPSKRDPRAKELE
jgi:uncharacterized protein (DUF983 family)